MIPNPFAGRFVDDLRPLFEAGAELGERLMPKLVELLDGPVVSYGKGAFVGVEGEIVGLDALTSQDEPLT